MSEEHVDRLAILEFIEGLDDTPRAEIAAHLAVCHECRTVWIELDDLIRLLRDGSILASIDDETAEPEKAASWDYISASISVTERQAEDGEKFFAELVAEPVDSWSAIVHGQAERCTSVVVSAILRSAELQLDRQPETALALTRGAEVVAQQMVGQESRLQLGHVWKQRSNALRLLGRYGEALDAARLAESLYASICAGSFEAAQAQYTRAATLFMMTRYTAALEAVAEARATLEAYGITAPLAKAMMLDAIIRVEQGEIAVARESLRRLLLIEERLGQHLEAARVRENLAECSLRMGDLDDAMVHAVAAAEAFGVLENKVEQIRAEWTITNIRLARGEEALDDLVDISGAFEALGVRAEAAFVKLDIVEELLHRGDYESAASMASQLVTLFVQAGVTLASANALDYLRQAAEKRAATEEMVRYVRKYVAADDPAQPFDPPAIH